MGKGSIKNPLPNKEDLTMEQKKTLWIVAASGIFLLVVVGAALILYSPSLQPSSGMQAGFDPNSGWISSTKESSTPIANELAFNSENTATATENKTPAQNAISLAPSPFDSLENAPSGESQKIAQNDGLVRTDKLTVISDNATVYSSGTTTIDLNSLKNSTNSGIVAKNEMTANQLSSNHPEPLPPSPQREVTPAPVENYYTPAPVVKAVETKKPSTSSTKASPAKPAAKSTAVAKSVTTKSSNKSSTAAKVAASAKKAPDSFWVQAAAYTSKRNADEARSTLESNKIPSEVFTFTDSNGKTFYRVRVGPYVTKSEAEYWQTRIGMIDKFASAKSVIVNTAVN